MAGKSREGAEHVLALVTLGMWHAQDLLPCKAAGSESCDGSGREHSAPADLAFGQSCRDLGSAWCQLPKSQGPARWCRHAPRSLSLMYSLDVEEWGRGLRRPSRK